MLLYIGSTAEPYDNNVTITMIALLRAEVRQKTDGNATQIRHQLLCILK